MSILFNMQCNFLPLGGAMLPPRLNERWHNGVYRVTTAYLRLQHQHPIITPNTRMRLIFYCSRAYVQF